MIHIYNALSSHCTFVLLVPTRNYTTLVEMSFSLLVFEISLWWRCQITSTHFILTRWNFSTSTNNNIGNRYLPNWNHVVQLLIRFVIKTYYKNILKRIYLVFCSSTNFISIPLELLWTTEFLWKKPSANWVKIIQFRKLAKSLVGVSLF